MARSNTSFAKGHKAGKGRPKLPADILAIKALSKEDILLAICSVMRMTYPELEDMRENS